MSTRTSYGGIWWWLGVCADALAAIGVPADCRLCERPLEGASRVPVCGECLNSFPRITGAICSLCGQLMAPGEMLSDQPDLCRSCCEERFAFDVARSFGVYRESLVRAVLLLKYAQVEPLGAWFAKRLAEVVREEGGLLRADIVVPVPLHRQRQRERGFNQVELFARPLAKLLKLPYRPVLLVRKRPRPEKHLLTKDERQAAVRGAFAMQKGARVDNSRVLLLDDVMTTGATLDACSGALREAGAVSVLGLTIARAAGPATR
jgi:competence protein ComFC